MTRRIVFCTQTAKPSFFSIDRANPPKHCFSSLFLFHFFLFRTTELWTRFEYTWRERDRFDEISNFHFRRTTTLGNQYFSPSFCCCFLFEYVHDHKKQRQSSASCPTNNKENTQQNRENKKQTQTKVLEQSLT